MAGHAPTLGPTRVRFNAERTAPIAGAWYPYTSALADELGKLSIAVKPFIGDITSISTHWQSYKRFPGLDSADSPAIPPLMTITTERTAATILVIPCRTSSSLAASLLRLASDTTLLDSQMHSMETQRARRILALASKHLLENQPAAATS